MKPLLTQLSAIQTNVDNERFVCRYVRVCVCVCLCHKARGKWLKCRIIKQSQQPDECSNLLLFFDYLSFPQLNFHRLVDFTALSWFEFGLKFFWFKFALHNIDTIYVSCLIEERNTYYICYSYIHWQWAYGAFTDSSGFWRFARVLSKNLRRC